MNENFRILFVDDDYNVINGLKRALYSYRNTWKMFFVNGGEEAIKTIESQEIDIIFCDIMMPKIDGTQVLKHIYDNHPHIVRFVLSGHSNLELIVKSTKYAHQFLSKPVSPEIIIEKVKRVDYARDFLIDLSELEILKHYKESPFNSKIYNEIEKEINKENSDISKIAEIVKSDPFISGKILQIANSGFFAISREITSILEGITYIGLTIVQKLILFFNTFNLKFEKKYQNIEFQNIARHSLELAFILKKMASKMKNNCIKPDDAFIIGLLASIGKIVLLINDMDTEKRFNHLSAYILCLWGLPESIIYSIYNMNNPLSEINNYQELSSLIYICNFIFSLDQKKLFEELTALEDHQHTAFLVEQYGLNINNIHSDIDLKIIYQTIIEKNNE